MRHRQPQISLALLLLFLELALLCGPAHAGEATAGGPADNAARQCTTLVYSANPHYPPYHWANGPNSFDGASIELLKLITPPGVRLKPVVYPWKRALVLARQGEIDLIVSLRITPERNEFLRFAEHRAFPNPIAVFVRKDRAFSFKTWADLKGRRGGISLGDTFGNGFDEYLRQELTFDEAQTMESNFAKLEAGRIDWFVTSRYAGAAYAASQRLRVGFTSLHPSISEQDIHMGFSRVSPCAGLAEAMSRRLEELDRQGVLEKILRRHLRRLEEGTVTLPK